MDSWNVCTFIIMIVIIAALVKGLNAGGMKWVSGFPENVQKGIPSIVGLIVMNDCETGMF